MPLLKRRSPICQHHGQGATAKLLNQLLCGVHLAVAAAVTALAERTGLDLQVFYELILAGSAMSRMFEDRVPQMSENQEIVRSALDLFVKDLGLAVDLGKANKAPTFLAAIAHQIFLAASSAGLGQRNDSQVIAFFRSLPPEPHLK
jgi:L-threonate 2-dehydrogenase